MAPFIVARVRHLDNTSDIQLTSRDTGLLVALYAVGLLGKLKYQLKNTHSNLVGSPLFGWLGDKIKQRRIPMLLGTGASISANILFMFSLNYPMLLIARLMQGISNACVWTMCLCLIADNWPKEQLGKYPIILD